MSPSVSDYGKKRKTSNPTDTDPLTQQQKTGCVSGQLSRGSATCEILPSQYFVIEGGKLLRMNVLLLTTLVGLNDV